MEIREINETELEELLNLYDHLHDLDDPLPSKDIVAKIWKEIQDNKNIKFFGVYVENILVSACTIALIPNLTRACRPYSIIENVVTHADHRRKGYGKMVLKTALDFAWQNNCYKVMLMTSRLNKATFQFYESVGFNRYEKQAFIAKPKPI